MDKKDYFNNLINLYEAIGMAGTEEVIPQEQIADSGSDVIPAPQGSQEIPEDEENQEMENEIPQPQEEIPADTSLIIEKQKFVKIFNFMKNLVDYGEAFIESIKCIDINLWEFEVYKEMRKYTTDLENLLEKIKNYMINIFNSEDYERVLHAYILFRTELVVGIKGLRKILKLDQTEDEEKN